MTEDESDIHHYHINDHFYFLRRINIYIYEL